MNEPWHGSDHGYGSISYPDVKFIEEMMRLVVARFPSPLRILEIGIANGYTGRGMVRFLTSLGSKVEYHGIDGECGKPHPGVLPEGGTFHQGDSTEIFESIPDGYQFMLIDACHCSNHCSLDFLNYGPKLVRHGIVIFHDTNPNPNWQGHYWQGHGPKTPAFGIGTRAALRGLGLSPCVRNDWRMVSEHSEGDMLGMMAFERLA